MNKASLAVLDERPRIAVLGLGYVGLPLAVAFAGHHDTLGFDIDQTRIDELGRGCDRTREVARTDLLQADLGLSSDPAALAGRNVFIVTVPTPIDARKRPDLTMILAASETVGRALRPGGVIIFESTGYPGLTEEDCVPVIERASGLVFNRDFFVGYSPERANPGDQAHRLASVVKVTSGSTPAVADFVDALYRQVVAAGTHKASSIRVAEAAKVIENTQRDLNIALVNEFAVIFNRLGLDTREVLEAAATKWNFLPFRPGLVGGHCIGVDPYYLTYKAQAAGYHPEVILAGRRINDGMGAYVAGQLVKRMIRRRIQVEGARVLVLGLAFKENCPDLRNTRAIDVIRELRDYSAVVEVYDPHVDPGEAKRHYGLDMLSTLEPGRYDAMVLAVAHREFLELTPTEFRALGKSAHVLYDVKGMLPPGAADAGL